MKGKGWMKSPGVDVDVEVGGEIEVASDGVWVGKGWLQPQAGELSRDAWSIGSPKPLSGGVDFCRSQCFSEKTGMSEKAQ